eukprot:CAMPEP_0202726420 /NCGR_PEP_ID=MMETSP1385-20130828/184600_1 /ASSEMBLY_ACC=CAM_ASM_000861 /TAXON_ID=933848 /ORGANISM="Elphidium margaritaceum" /LENGTH=349 /DNA_ID=CAMNT_0049392641 /DNA_START=117 /DNA_END=1166 /DNA_ORIENTATION=+
MKMDVHQRAALHEGKQSSQRSDDMPAGVVLLLLCIFIALGLVCIRHIKQEWNQRNALELAKQAGHIISAGGALTTHKYGSTASPVLNSQTIDEYIDERLHRGDNYPIMERLNRYQQTIVDYFQSTPEPVVFEARASANVDAFCRNPQIPSRSDIETPSVPLQHQAPGAGLQRLFNANFERAQQRKLQELKEEEENGKDEELEYNELKESEIDTKGKGKGKDKKKKASRKKQKVRASKFAVKRVNADAIRDISKDKKKKASRKKQKVRASKFAVKRVNADAIRDISLSHPMNMSDFRGADEEDDESGYDEIMDKARSAAYSDSDRALSDDDGGGDDNCPMETKVVVFDTD